MATPLSGEVVVRTDDIDIVSNGEFNDTIKILPVYHNGSLCEQAAGAEILATAEQDGESRVLASIHSTGKGRIGFVRALSPYLEESPVAHNRTLRQSRRMKGDGAESYPAERLVRKVLAEYGWSFRARVYEPGQFVPRLAISRYDNAFFFNGYTPDTTVEMEISTPLGVPLPIEREIRIDKGNGFFHMEKATRFCCRAFVKQQQNGTISTKTLHPHRPGIYGRIDIIGLQQADVRFFPPPDCDCITVLQRDIGGIFGPVPSASGSNNILRTEIEETPFGNCHTVKNVNGIVNIAWGKEK
jgi:hypothetical protein